mgnify:CR=1 FL=1
MGRVGGVGVVGGEGGAGGEGEVGAGEVSSARAEDLRL